MKTFQNNWENYSEINEIPSEMAVSAVSKALERAVGDRGNKVFELSNHLGNVLATVSDKKLGRVLDTTSFVAAYYEGQVRSVQDYYAFGWGIPSRSFSAGDYRFGFNGKENDSDFGEQLIQDYGFRIYNPSIGKFLSVDPLAPDYPWYTPYQFAGNTPIQAIDLDGLEPMFTNSGDAQRVANDVNSLLFHLYNPEYNKNSTPRPVPKVKIVSETKVAYQWNLKLVGTAPLQSLQLVKEKVNVPTGRYFMRADLNTPWRSFTKKQNTGTYVKALFESLESGRVKRISFGPGRLGVSRIANLKEAKGFTKSSSSILLWDGLKEQEDMGKPFEMDEELIDKLRRDGFSEKEILELKNDDSPDNINTRSTVWTVGGTFLHELINHTNPNFRNEGAHRMQNALRLKPSSSNHKSSVSVNGYSEQEKKKIESQLNKTK